LLSVEENKLLTQVAAGTPMGEMLRRYWHPVCAVDQVLESPFRTREVKILGEELVVYLDRSGRLGIVDKYCTHRRASLAYGVVEQDGIRCQYHGWKFDETGRCIEQPFEDTVHPEDRFRDKCSIRAYKAEAMGGLVFAYMGPQPVPLLPRWGLLTWDNCVRDIAITHLPCNWVQCQENSCDSTHNEHLHDYGGNYFREILDGREPTWKRTRKHLKIGYDEYKYGIIKRRITEDRDENHPRWRIGHSILFPNILWHNSTMQIRVPIDEENTLHFSVYLWRAAPGTVAPRQDVVPSRIVQLLDENGRYNDLQRTFNQDYLAWSSQGPVAKRDLEKLGAGDTGVIKFRSLLIKQMNIVQDGGEPTMNIFRTPDENSGLEWPNIPFESMEFVGGATEESGFKYRPGEGGYSRDADKIEQTMRTWQGVGNEVLAASGLGR